MAERHLAEATGRQQKAIDEVTGESRRQAGAAWLGIMCWSWWDTAHADLNHGGGVGGGGGLLVGLI